MIRLLFAFLRRDFQIAASYRASFFFMIVGGLVTLTTFYFLAQTIGDAPVLRGHGGDYFSFALIGVAVASSLRALQTSFAQRLREAQTDGSLEVLLSAPLTTFRVISLLAAYPIVQALLRALALLAAGAVFFGASLRLNAGPFLLVLLLGLCAFGALGLLSAAFVMTFKRGDPFSYAIDVATYLLSGVVYPIQVLPPALRVASKFLPATWALEGLRATGLRGASLGEVKDVVLILVLFSAVLWPLAGIALSWARRHAERTGTLAHG